ncbi:MAG: HAD family hydrolase [Anaerolineae bacterium]|nr:HAD family hydrolase [Anaerolineae bacterium]MCA9887473.1 HAD family hydrolase [Anaerolineae bacterium]
MALYNKLFIFDFDGTLADSRMNIANSLNFALHQHGFTEVPHEEVYPLIGKLTLAETFEKFCDDLDAQRLDALMASFSDYQLSHIAEEIVLFPQVRSTLAELDNRGATMAIATTKRTHQIETILKELGLADYFKVVFGQGTLPVHKPDPACVQYIWDRAGKPFNPDETVMIGDSEVDVKTAVNAGIHMIAVTHGTDTPDTMRQHGAEHFVGSFDELLNEELIENVFAD